MNKMVSLRVLTHYLKYASIPILNIWLFLFLLVGLLPIQASAIGSTQYTVDRVIADQGGARLSNPSYSAFSSLGVGNEAGVTVSTNSKLQGGFVSALDGIVLSPVASQTIDEDTSTIAIPLSISLGATNPANWILTASSANTELLPNANIVFAGSGGNRIVTATPVQNKFGSAVVTITVADGYETTSSALTVTVNPVNDTPVTSNGSLATNEDMLATGTLSASDVDGDILTYSIVTNGTKGVATITNATTGTFIYLPNANANGSDSFTFKVNDGTLDSNISTTTVTINPVNDASISTNGTLTINEDESGTGTLIASDVDDTSLTYSIISNGIKGVVAITDAATGTYTYVPNANLNGTDIFTFKVSDGKVDSNVATVTVTITPVNDTPIASDDINLNSFVGMHGSTTLSGTDIDNDSLIYIISSLATNGKLYQTADGITLGDEIITVGTIITNAQGQVIHVPNAGWSGTDSFNYSVSDGTNISAAAVVNITAKFVSMSSSQYTIDRVHANQGATAASSPSYSAYSVIGRGNEAGAVATTTSSLQGGFITAFDGMVLSSIANQTINEDTAITAIPLTISGSSIDPANWSLTATSSNQSLLPVTNIVFGGSGASRTIIATPITNGSGTALVTVTATDGQLTSKNQFTVTVNPVNDAPTATSGSFAVNEDTAYTGSLIGSDVDGNALTFSVVAQGAKGTITITNAATGAFTYTPNVNSNGADSFTFKVNDGLLNSNTATMTLSIQPINDAPVALNNTSMTNEDTEVSGTLGAVDVDADTLTFSIIANGAKGQTTITNVATGAYTYKPTANVNGVDTFTFKVNDGTLDSNVATITVTINEVNDIPIATDGTLSVTEDTTTNSLLPYIHPDTHGMTFTILQNGSKGVATITNETTGAYSYVPNSNVSGIDFFTFKVNDGVGESNTATITVTITPVNDAPVATNGTLSIDEDTIGTGTFVANDVENNVLTYSISSNGSKGIATIINAKTGAYSYTPNANVHGVDSFNFKVNDGTVDSNTATIMVTIKPVNDAPVVTNGTLTINEDTVGTGTLIASDVDGNALTYSIISQASKGVVAITNASTGGYTYTPNVNTHGSDSFTYKVNDGTVDSNTSTIVVTINPVNDTPVAIDASFSTNEDTTGIGTLKASDVDGDSLVYTVVANGTQGTATITNSATGAFSYTPNLHVNGSDSFTFKVNDGTVDSNIATINVTINSITPNNIIPIAEDGLLTVTEDVSANGLLPFTHPDTHATTFTILQNGTKGVATITNETTGAYSYVPNANANGTDFFTFKVSDEFATSSPATITVTIIPVNDAPISQEGTLTIQQNSAGSGLLSASDVDSTILTYTIITNGAKGLVTLTDASTGAYTYTPNLNAKGTDSFTFKVNDGEKDSNTATITVTINATFTAPIAENGLLSLDEDSTATSSLTAHDADGDSLTYTIVTNGGKGTATITDATTGAYTYTANANLNGTDSFTFKVSDSTKDSNVATITVNINPVNDAPVAEDGTLSTNEDSIATGALRASDVDGDSLTYMIVTNGSKGVVAIIDAATGAYSYTPNLNANGQDTFIFKTTDETLDSNSATITVTINSVNDVPIATQNIHFITVGGLKGTIALSGTDADNDTLHYVIQSLPLNGKLYQTVDGVTLESEITTIGTELINVNERVIFVPSAGWSGTDTFNFVVKDAKSNSSSAAVTITVQAKPELTAIENLSVKFGQTPINIPFSVLNKEQAIGTLTFQTKSWNNDLIPDANIQVIENGAQYILVVAPVANQDGTAFISMTVKDDINTSTVSFALTIESKIQTPVLEAIISGVVKNAAGIGVEGVLVRFQSEFDVSTGSMGSWGETITDTNGNYSFNAKPGRYRIEFITSYKKAGENYTVAGNFTPGFANGTGGIVNDWNQASVFHVIEATQVDVTFETGVILSGTVKKSGDIPVPGAEVQVHSKDWSVFFHTKTNIDGQFSIMVNPSLEYQVDVWPAYCDAANTVVEQGCGIDYIAFQGGSWITPQDSTWVSGWRADDITTQPLVVASAVSAGIEIFGTVMRLSDDHMVTNIKIDTSININVLVDSGVSVQGRVINSTGGGVADAWVGTSFGGVSTNQEGYFTINLPSASSTTNALSTFAINIFPGGHEDATSHAWIQGTNFIGGEVTGDVTNGFVLTDDTTKSTQFTPTETAWPTMNLLGDANQTGLLVQVSGGIAITGTIQDGSGQKLANMWVNTWSHDTAFGAGASTNSEGIYSILVPTPTTGHSVWYELNLWSDRYLVPEAVLVKVQSNGVVGVYQVDKTNLTVDGSGLFKPVAGTVIQENSNGAVPVNFTLTTGHTISGRVTDANNNGKPWTWVDIHTKDGTKWYGANTDENGNYIVTVPPADNYVGVIWGSNGQYRTTFYRNSGKEENATLINTVGGNVDNIDFMLNSGAKISGTIAGLPFGKKVWLNVWSESENAMGGVVVTGKETSPVNFVITGLALANDYRLDWRSTSEEIPSGFYGGVLDGTASGSKSWEQATLLSTINGNVTGVGIDLASITTKTLTVKVTGLTVGTKVDANVRSEKLNMGRWKQETANASGEVILVVKGLDASGDDYRLFIGGPDTTFKVGNFKGAVDATSYPTTAGSLVGFDQATLINMSSDQFVNLAVNSGRQLTVTVAGLQQGQKAWVDVFSETTGTWGGGEIKYVDGTTDKVVIKGLDAADDYRVTVWGDKIQGGSYAGSGKSLGSWETAELVDLTTADTTISMIVSTGRSISGSISGLKKKESAWLDAWSNSTYSWGGKVVQSGGAGSDSYTIEGVSQANDFKVKFDSAGYMPQSKSDVDTKTQDATGVDFTVSTGGSITGSITGLNALERVKLDAWSPSGDYLIVGSVLADSTGTATYMLSGIPAATDYAVGLWRGNKGVFYSTSGVTPIWDNHTAVTVAGSDITKSINFDLTAAGTLFYTLSGTVSGLSSDQVVEIKAWSSTAGASTTITGNGTYKLEGLPSGNYTVEVTSNGYAPQHTDVVTVSNGVVSSVTWNTGWNRSGTVAVTSNTTELNVIISKGYFIKGTVTNNGNAVSGVLVNAWSANDFVGDSATTNSKGEFMIKGLPNLTYLVEVWTPEGVAAKEVIVNGVNQSNLALIITKAGGSISGNVTTSTGGVAGEAMVIAFDNQGAEKQRAVANSSTGAYVLDGLNIGESYTVKAFSSTKANAGNWTMDTGFATGTAIAVSGGAVLNLGLN